MTLHLSLLCCAATATARRGGFADPVEPLDEGGRRQAAARVMAGPAATAVVAAPGAAARETAAAMDLMPAVESALADMDWGAWRGRSFEEVAQADSGGFVAWLRDPGTGAPGGERFDDLVRRVAPWLEAVAQTTGRVIVVTQAMPIRALLVAAIGVPAAAAFRIDIAPLSLVELSFNRGWRLRELRRG